MDIPSESSTMHQQPQQSITQPLHSSSQSNDENCSCYSSQFTSLRRNSRCSKNRSSNHHRLSLSFILVALILTAMPSPTQAKYRLVPKRKRNTNKRQAAAASANNKANTKILLKPRKKETVNLQLEATVSTNESGQKVLLLSPESTQAVESAMQSSSNQSNEVQLNQMEAKQPKKQMSVVEESTVPQQGAAAAEEQKVLFYDPDELKTSPGEPPLPKKVYDENGKEVDMAGKEALLIKPHPPQPESKSDEKQNTNNKKSDTDKISPILQTTQGQDQVIILSTVATMALLVGALSARRMRSRQFLSFCIENESLEDELAYDAAFTTQSTVGASSFYAGGGYDTFASGKYGGDLRWRGDLEKFDV